MSIRKQKSLVLFISLLLIFTVFYPAAYVKAEDNVPFYIYVCVIDENGNAYTGTGYEPGFTYNGFQNHMKVAPYGAALIGVYKTEDSRYRYWQTDVNSIYDPISESLLITENYSVVKVELALKNNGKTKLTVIKPGDASYPKDPLNPTGLSEIKYNIHGYVKNKNGGVKGSLVTAKHSSNMPVEAYTATAVTDSNGYFTLSIDKKRFTTANLYATKDDVVIPIVEDANQTKYSIGVYNPWNETKSYDFYSEDVISNPSDYSISLTGGTATHALAAPGTKITITANNEPGKQFDKWTSPDSITFENPTSPVTSFTMPDHAVTINGVFSDLPPEIASVSAVTISPPSIDLKRGSSYQFYASVQGNGQVSQEVNWTVENAAGSSISPEGLLTVNENEAAASFYVKAASKAEPEKFTSAVVNVVHSSMDGETVTPPNAPLSIPDINVPLSPKKNKSGNYVITVTDKILKQAITNAKKDQTDSDITKKLLILNLQNKDKLPLQVAFSKGAISALTTEDISQVKIQGKNISMTMDSTFLKYIQKLSRTGFTLQFTKTSAKSLRKDAKKAIGTHPVYKIRATYAKKSGKKNVIKEITDFKTGKVTVSLPYKLRKGESGSKICAIYIQKTGKPTKIKASVYSKKEKQLAFPIKRFSVISIGKK